MADDVENHRAKLASDVRVIADGMDHPECVITAPGGILYAGGEAGQIYRIDVNTGSATEFTSTGGWILGLALMEDGSLLACDAGRHEVLHIQSSGEVSVLSSGSEEVPFTTPNFVCFDQNGNAFVSDSGDWGKSNGRIYRIGPDGHTELWSRLSCAFPNGLALDSGGDFLYIAESTLPGVTRIGIGEDGRATDREVVIQMPGTVPDGIAFDVTGGLVIGCYRPDRIHYLDPSRKELTVLADDPEGTAVGAPTNVAFGGGDGRELYFANFARWHVASIRAAAPGLPLRTSAWIVGAASSSLEHR